MLSERENCADCAEPLEIEALVKVSNLHKSSFRSSAHKDTKRAASDGREYITDSGATVHMMCRKSINVEEITVRNTKKPCINRTGKDVKTWRCSSSCESRVTIECRSDNHVPIVAVTKRSTGTFARYDAGGDSLPHWLQPLTKRQSRKHHPRARTREATPSRKKNLRTFRSRTTNNGQRKWADEQSQCVHTFP